MSVRKPVLVAAAGGEPEPKPEPKKPALVNLDEVIAKPRDNRELRYIVVNGHADRLGSNEYNQKRSEKRADAVRAYLVSRGVDASKVETCPAENRRVVVRAPRAARARSHTGSRQRAHALGLGERIGPIEAGKRADLVAVALRGPETASEKTRSVLGKPRAGMAECPRESRRLLNPKRFRTAGEQ